MTEAGLLPEDWHVNHLNTLAERIMVGIASAATHAYREKGVPLLRNQNIKPNHLDDADVLHVDPTYEVAFRNKRLRTGDLLTARTGYPGTTCSVPEKFESAQSFTTLITRPKTQLVDSLYLCQYINSERGQKFFEQTQIGGAQKNVNAGTLRTMPVPVPLIEEQRVIASALSNVDNLLTKLDQLTTKKRDLKQAARQQLLSGQTRLPGFSGEWEEKQFFEICQMKSGEGITSADIDDYSKFPCYGGNGLRGFTARYTHDGAYALIGRQGALCGNVLCVKGQFFASEHAIVVTPLSCTDVRWLAVVLAEMNLNQYSESSAQPGLSVSRLLSFTSKTPLLAEQTAIAKVLSDMDAELNALEARHKKTRLIKQGMMQELLTGKTRLI